MKKILIYSIFFYPSIGGVQSTTRILAQALVELGYIVTIFTNTPLDDQIEIDEGYRIIRSSNWIELVSLCSDYNLVVIKGGVSVIAGLAAWLAQKPYFFYHEMIGSYLYNHDFWKGLLTNHLRAFLVKKAIAHVGVTRSCLESKQLNLKKTQFVIYNPVSQELQLFAESPKYQDQDKFYDILFVGRLLRAKGIYVLADALKIFEKEQKSLRVCFVGSGEDYPLQEYLKDCSCVKVDFLGSLQGERLAEAYASSRLSVIPSSSHPEGMGLVIAEAFMFNLPVIGSSQPAIKEVINHKGLIFENGSARDLYDKLNTILFDLNSYEYYRSHAKKEKRKYTYAEYFQKIKSCLATIEIKSYSSN